MRFVKLLDDEKEEENLRGQAITKRLNEAAMEGSVTLLLELLREDPNILDKANSYLSDKPLHVAALLGHSAFAKHLLTQKPELATELNAHGSSALHMAAAKGHAEIVKELLLVNPDMCLVQDSNGRTPLHLAAIKGKVEALTELVRFKPEATRVLTAGGESGLHLSVKNNRLVALKALVESVGEDDQFVNWRDSDGNSVLHISVAKKQLEMIRYLINNTKIEVNARNANGFTAMELLLHSPRDLRDMEIKESLEKAGASRISKVQAISNSQDIVEVEDLPPRQEETAILKKTDSKPIVKKHKQHTDWLGRKRSALMVVASLLATVAFSASLSPPGGVWQEDYTVDSDGNPVEHPHRAGLSVMADTDPQKYQAFMILNTLAFISSLSIILLLISGLPMRKRRFMWVQMVIMWVAISAFTATYYVALIEITPRHVKATLFSVTVSSLMIGLGMIGVVFLGNVIRMCLWFLREYGYIKPKEKRDSLYVEEEENDE
ncbi:hypothetical protein COLO4_21112 [Corchorus olitorius]|uniref:PGG domain-containing protein n=1 Tax=Corchorus olitorius TaxID=93759 RepID=A0A1R3IVC3_9ROSI|nr:hypothetical protein COLO4_21112 [Corchorus olitorius]